MLSFKPSANFNKFFEKLITNLFFSISHYLMAIFLSSTVELFMLSHVEKRKKSVVGKSIVLRGQKVV
jgi:hypothetical protein